MWRDAAWVRLVLRDHRQQSDRRAQQRPFTNSRRRLHAGPNATLSLPGIAKDTRAKEVQEMVNGGEYPKILRPPQLTSGKRTPHACEMRCLVLRNLIDWGLRLRAIAQASSPKLTTCSFVDVVRIEDDDVRSSPVTGRGNMLQNSKALCTREVGRQLRECEGNIAQRSVYVRGLNLVHLCTFA